MSEPDGALTLVCVGTSHRVAAVPFIERALHGAERYRQAWIETAGSGSTPAVQELVLLATCNRVELWVASASAGVDHTIRDLRGVLADGQDAADRVYALHGPDALRHLCRVAVGLDSMVVGEPQIAGQVARAFKAVLHANGGSPVLGTAVRTARLASRRARNETAISRGTASISTVAVHVASERMGGLTGARVLVVGAGKIGGLACRALRDSGANLTIINRTPARAEHLAARVGARVRPLDSLAAAVAESDVVIASTASPHPIVDMAMLRPALASRPAGRSLLLIDIAVPRNIAADAGDLADVTLLGIDDLRRRVRAHLEERCAEIPRAESIIDEVLHEHGRADAHTLTVIGDMRRRAERIRRNAVRRTLDGLAGSDAGTRERIEHLSRILVNRLLHDPTIRLRSAADRGMGDDYSRIAADLFALEQDPHNRRTSL